MVRIRTASILLFALVLLCALPFNKADAATLFISPGSDSYNVGSTFSVGVYVSSSDQAMNAASGVVSFPADKLTVLSVSKSSSIFSLWPQEPSFSNNAGTVKFEGIVLNPGYTGASGKVVTVNFKVKSPGTALVSFSSGSVLANDGLGTNILKSLGTAQYSLGGSTPSAPESSTPSVVSNSPSATLISSPTHPDPNRWYSGNDVNFTWPVPSSVISNRVLFNKIAKATPTTLHTPAIDQYSVDSVADGIWYAHIQSKNDSGWGEISHFRVQIDSEKPDSFYISAIEKQDKTDPKTSFIFKAVDAVSGIDHYAIQIDGKNYEAWKDTGNHTYQTPALAPGKHTLIAEAVDKAGNGRSAVIEFNVIGIDPPVIEDFPREIESGQLIVIRGKTYADSKVSVWFKTKQGDAKEYSTKSDEAGVFTAVTKDKLQDGEYDVWATVTDIRGAQSIPSVMVSVIVSKTALFRFGSYIVEILSVLIPVVILLISLIFISIHGFHRVKKLRKRLHKETREVESAIEKSFNLLRDDITDHLEMLKKAENKRDLTKEEGKIMKELRRDLDDAERFIKKELETIDKELD